MATKKVDWQQVSTAIFVTLSECLADNNKCWIAYSGGLDSSVLLHAVCRSGLAATESLSVRALHVNHRLSPNAERWVDHCRQQCNLLGIGFDVVEVDVVTCGDGIEAAARQARYRVFEEKLAKGGCLLQGHHLNDQVETVLFRLFRGLGLAGLAGIPQRRQLAEGNLFRPLLGIPRGHIECLAREWGLSWIEDESNSEQCLDRNYIRHQIMPPLLKRWPGALQRIGVSARWLREALELTDELARIDLEGMICQGESLKTPAFKSLSPLRQKNSLKYWLQSRQLTLSERHLDAVLNAIRTDNTRSVHMSLNEGMTLVISQQFILCINSVALNAACKQLIWDGYSSLTTPLGELQLLLVKGKCGNQKLLRMPQADEVVTVKYRVGGETFSPMGRQGSCSLKKWLHEKRIPRWQRSYIPLIYYNDQIAAVADLAVDTEFLAQDEGLQVLIRP